MTYEEFRAPGVVAMLRAAVAAAGGTRAFAAKHDLHASVVSNVANGRREIPESVANALGLIRVVTFQRIGR
jgi:hypothetical protein